MSTYEGPLTLLSSYQDRSSPSCFATLKEYTLYVYEDQERQNAVRVIPLKGCHVQFMVANDSVPIFKVTGGEEDQTYFFSSDDEKSLEKWMGEILNAIEEEALAPQYKDKSEQVLYEKSQQCLAKPHWLTTDDTTLGPVLGSGTFGCVHSGTCHGSVAAIKVMHKQQLDASLIEDFVLEVEILHTIKAPNVLLFMGACLSPLMIVTELMEGSLDDIIHSNAKYSLPFLLRLTIDCARGLSWLHSLRPMIIHRDVKPENFLYDRNYRVVIADFGLSEKLKKGEITWDLSAAGTVTWLAPEIAKQATFDEMCDIYSLALVIFALVTKSYPFAELDALGKREFITKVVWNNYRPAFPADIYLPYELQQLITTCWSDDPKQRYSALEVTERLIEVRLHETIKLEKARKFWIKNFANKQELKWDDFAKKFQPLQAATPEQTKMQTMMFLQKGTISGTEIITDERFGLCISWFGTEQVFQKNLEKIITNRAFFGDQSPRRVAELLSGTEEGTYLVRLIYTSHGLFAIDYLEDEELKEMIVKRESVAGLYVPFICHFLLGSCQHFAIVGSDLSFTSLKKLIASCTQLKTPCARSPFKAFYTKTLPYAHLSDK